MSVLTNWSWAAAGVGAMLGSGLLLVWAGLPMRHRPDLMSRVGPYVKDRPRPSRLLARQGEQGWMHQVLERLGSYLEVFLGGAASVRLRLERAGLAPDVADFRARQALWGVVAGVIGALLGAGRVLAGSSLVLAVLIVAASILVGVVLCDQMLTRRADRREERIMAEFPSVAEMLALAVTAGEGASAALERVTRLSTGELSGELRRCLSDARAGATLTEALQGLADRTGIASLARFVDGVVVAVERGTPLADVMRAQAQDAREASKQHLIEIGGKREISMMVPVVFLALPITVLFVAYPTFGSFQLSS